MGKTRTSFKKGKSGNIKGRTPGSKNRSSEEIRKVLLNFLNDNIDNLQGTYDKLDPNGQVKLLSLIFRYTITLPFDPENLSIENLQQIINYLKNGQQQKSFISSN